MNSDAISVATHRVRANTAPHPDARDAGLRAELGIKAKGMLLMREAGFEAEPDPSLRPKLEEVHYLEKNIGRTGMRALKPFVHTSTQDLWQMNLLDGTK